MKHSLVTVMLVCCVTLGMVAAEEAMPVRVCGPWTISLGPGAVDTGQGQVTLGEAAELSVLPPARIAVRNEVHSGLPVFDEKAGGWRKGARLKALITEECTATGALYPETLCLKAGPEKGAAVFVLDKDYRIDPFWGTVGRVEGGAIPENAAVYADYVYSPERLDSVVVDGAGTVRLVAGPEGLGSVLPGAGLTGETVVARVFVRGSMEQLDEDAVFCVHFGAEAALPDPVAETLLPKTLAKLRGGETVTIVAFGDSVTNGGGVDGHVELRYQTIFAERLQARFPQAKVVLRTAAWGGASSQRYIDAPAGGEHDYVRDVLDPHADLVTIEFVNDAYLDEAGVEEHYGKILADLQGVGSEVVLITPHLVRPDWLPTDTLKVKEDPRAYVRGLYAFGATHGVAVADASRLWCGLWKQGIPYTTLLANSINHPDARGHEIFVKALLALFPEK